MSASDCCLGFNPDITGIGVRVALYIQIVLGYVVSLVWPDTFAKNARTAYMTAIALIIAALIQYKTQPPQELSLLDAIVVSLITTMMITFAISSGPTRSKVKETQAGANANDQEVDPNASFSRFLTQFAFVGLWAGWCLNLWHDPLHFGFKGTLPECNINEHVIIVLFGRNINATDERMQKAALAFVSIGIVLAFGSLWISLEQLLSPFIKLFRKQLEAYRANRDPNAQPPEDIILTVIRKFLQALSFATLIFLIVETEATIRRNDTENSTKDWSYGQTIALILLLQQIMDVSSTYLEKMAERKEEKERKAAMSNSTPLTTPSTLLGGNPPIKHSPSPSPSPAPPAFPVPQINQNAGAGSNNP